MAKKKSSYNNQLRIIGGRWRGRKLPFADGQGLRPTLDRVRETLFNWLQFDIAGSNCLDLFTGSGALGLEALSRGAAQVTMLDINSAAIQQIRNNLSLLKCHNAELLQQDALSYLQNPATTPYHIVFLDPPFQQNLLKETCFLLESNQYLHAQAYIYIEAEKQLALSQLPENWQLLKEKKAGQLKYYLFQKLS